jgi:hypothetical protein
MSWILNPFFGSPSIHGILKRTQASLHASVIPTAGSSAGTLECCGHIDVQHLAAPSGHVRKRWLAAPTFKLIELPPPN